VVSDHCSTHTSSANRGLTSPVPLSPVPLSPVSLSPVSLSPWAVRLAVKVEHRQRCALSRDSRHRVAAQHTLLPWHESPAVRAVFTQAALLRGCRGLAGAAVTYSIPREQYTPPRVDANESAASIAVHPPCSIARTSWSVSTQCRRKNQKNRTRSRAAAKLNKPVSFGVTLRATAAYGQAEPSQRAPVLRYALLRAGGRCLGTGLSAQGCSAVVPRIQ
jgi:hypothetical protein